MEGDAEQRVLACVPTHKILVMVLHHCWGQQVMLYQEMQHYQGTIGLEVPLGHSQDCKYCIPWPCHPAAVLALWWQG